MAIRVERWFCKFCGLQYLTQTDAEGCESKHGADPDLFIAGMDRGSDPGAAEGAGGFFPLYLYIEHKLQLASGKPELVAFYKFLRIARRQELAEENEPVPE